MSDNPLVSIIMPCFNAAKYIENTITRLFEQTYSCFELIVVDDGSRDESLAILNRLSGYYPAISVVTQANQGAGAARNVGLKLARGEFVAFLDADDGWDAEFLSVMVAELVSNPDVVLVYCGWQNLGLQDKFCRPYIPDDFERKEKILEILAACPWPIHAALIRKAVIDQVGGFDESLTSCMDYDLWLRIAVPGLIHRVEKVLAYYFHHDGDQITKNRLKIALNHWHVQQKFLRAHPDVVNKIGKERVADVTKGRLLRQAYKNFWDRDLITAQTLFRKLLFSGYFCIADLKYMLPALLPYGLYRNLIVFFDRGDQK